MDTSGTPEFDLHLSVHLSRFEADGLAHLCHLMEWRYLAEPYYWAGHRGQVCASQAAVRTG